MWQGRGPIRKDERGNARVGKRPRAPWNANGLLIVGRLVFVAALTFELQEETQGTLAGAVSRQPVPELKFSWTQLDAKKPGHPGAR